MIKEAYDLAIRDGFNPQQARQFLTAQLPFLAERTIRLALPDEAKDQSKVPQHTLPQKPLPKTINISSEHPVIDVESIADEEIKTEQKKSEDRIIQEIEAEEDPLKIENDFLKEKVTELEDALRKTEQFKAASKLEAWGETQKQIQLITSRRKPTEPIHSTLTPMA